MPTHRRGLLSDHFEGVAVKKLSAVEADSGRSNQHELNGTTPLKKVLGTTEPKQFPTSFIWLSGEQEGVSEEGIMTWYDARRDHPTRSEYRLYYPTTRVSEMSNAGDTIFLALRTNGSLMMIVTPAGSTMQNQLMWLFGIEEAPGNLFEVQQITPSNASELDFAARYILDELGIEPEEPEADRMDTLLEQFGLVLPSTRDFSAFARQTLPEVNALDGADAAVVAWMEREEQLFRRMERRIVAERLRTGFMGSGVADVDGFLSFSLSVQNRRKSRAGAALENHLAAVFMANKIRFGHGVETENRNKPDFLFPGQTEYRNPSFPATKLTMLGSKSTLKDRWRQVLSEAVRIQQKHLFTLEPGISENQTNQMRSNNLQLVIPHKLHETYQPAQQAWLMTLGDFVMLVRQRQEAS